MFLWFFQLSKEFYVNRFYKNWKQNLFLQNENCWEFCSFYKKNISALRWLYFKETSMKHFRHFFWLTIRVYHLGFCKVLMQGKLFQRCTHFLCSMCTVFGRKSKHKTDVTAWYGIHFYKNNLLNILVIGNYYVNF